MQQHLWSIDMLLGFVFIVPCGFFSLKWQITWNLCTGYAMVKCAGNELMLIVYSMLYRIDNWFMHAQDTVFLQKNLIKSLKCYQRYSNRSLSGFFWVLFLLFASASESNWHFFYSNANCNGLLFGFFSFSLFTCVWCLLLVNDRNLLFCPALYPPDLGHNKCYVQLSDSVMNSCDSSAVCVNACFNSFNFSCARVCVWFNSGIRFKFNCFQCMANVRSSVQLTF